MTIYRYDRDKITGYALYFWQKEVQEELKQEYEDGNRWEDIYKITCWKCGEEFYCKNRRARYCSYRCVNDAQIARRKQRRELERQRFAGYAIKHLKLNGKILYIAAQPVNKNIIEMCY